MFLIAHLWLSHHCFFKYFYCITDKKVQCFVKKHISFPAPCDHAKFRVEVFMRHVIIYIFIHAFIFLSQNTSLFLSMGTELLPSNNITLS